MWDHITTQLQPDAGGAYGSSPFAKGPQTEGTCDSYDQFGYSSMGGGNMTVCRDKMKLK